jgi:hypothetical protein
MAEPISPVLKQVDRRQVISDPFVRELYFGSPDYAGLIQQARGAAQRYLDVGPTMRQTAGLSPLETAAIQRAYGGIGGYEPYLRAQEQAILGGMGTLGTARGLSRGTLRGFQPRDVGRFYDPFEEQVVQQTIQDVMKGGAQQDIAARARDIQTGGQSAFGSRARLGAGERQAALGRGLGEALSRIRSGGYTQALGAAQRESEFGRGALQRAAEFEQGLGRELSGFGRELGGLGQMYQQLGQSERQELMGLGAVPRELKEQQLGRQYDYQEALRQDPMRALQFVQGFAPQYQGGMTQVESQYRAPIDPLQQGLAAGLGAYASLYQPPQAGAAPATASATTPATPATPPTTMPGMNLPTTLPGAGGYPGTTGGYSPGGYNFPTTISGAGGYPGTPGFSTGGLGGFNFPTNLPGANTGLPGF